MLPISPFLRACLARSSAPALVAALAFCVSMPPAMAQDTMLLSQPSVYAQGAVAERGSHALTLGVTLPWRDWRGSFWGTQVTGYWDISLSRWAADGMQGRLNTTVFEATPSFRFTPDAGRSPFFLDAGVGVTMANARYMTRDKEFSTQFNFATHIGGGFAFGEQRRQEVQLRVQHVSNGGIRHPNPGENFLQLRYGVHF